MDTTATKIPCQNTEVIERVLCLTYPQKLKLIKKVNDQEILFSLKIILVDKALGVDSFIMEFFTGQWKHY